MFTFAGPITMNDASAALAAVRSAIDAGESDVSLAALGRSDSSAVAVLIAAQRHAETSGRTLRWIDVPESVASLARLYGVDGLIGESPSGTPPMPLAAAPRTAAPLDL